MAEGVLVGVAENVLMSVSQSAVQEVASWRRARGDLQKLGDTIRIIKAGLRDAEKRNAEENGANESLREWLRRVRNVLYRADDLFDEVFTVDQQRSQNMEGYRLGAKKVRILFSRSGPVRFNRKVAREIKSIREELETIKSDMEHLKLVKELGVQMPEACFMGKRETISFVQAEDVVGREDDKNHIIEALLLKPNNVDESITVIPIVGFGGIGKTTLAQLVFNDEKVQKHFDLTKWACVPDIGNNKQVIKKVFMAFTDRSDNDLSLEQLQSIFRESVNNKKYLLVLDDLWDESRDRWLDLMSLLRCSKRGSKIIVTTRSYVVAKIIGTGQEPYKLQMLSDDESWNLFKRLALKPGQEERNPNFTSIGKEIVERCANVPLAIRAIGSILYTKDTENEWMQFKGIQLSKTEQTGNIDIMPVLKLSYDNLPTNLKQCFAYCALFPKAYTFSKNELVRLWMGQGFIKPLNDNDSFEDAGDRYFEELLMRNFIQHATRHNKWPSVWEGGQLAFDDMLCKMHDLMHDLALCVAGEESNLVGVKWTTEQFHSELRHVRFNYNISYSSLRKVPSSLLNARQIRSVLNLHGLGRRLQNFEKMVSCFPRLRSLDLSKLDIRRVPDCIGMLRLLRYLNLSECCKITCLPRSIMTLWNLQTLNLYGCYKLKELPIGFSKMANLRHLDLVGCVSLISMPAGFRKLKSLQKLTDFIVGEGSGLDALADMNLRGELTIDYRRWRDSTIEESTRVNLKGKEQLCKLTLTFKFTADAPTPDDSMLLLEHLQPPPSLKVLSIRGHSGEAPPWWMGDMLPSFLPNLAELRISFKSWRILPAFSQLRCLKRLTLDGLENLEYIESGGSNNNNSTESCSYTAYFPSLEFLQLTYLSQLKGWWRSVEDDQNHQQNLHLLPIFPRLFELEIWRCPKLISIPVGPKLKVLSVFGIQGKQLNQFLMIGEKIAAAGSSSTSTYLSELEELLIFQGLPNMTALPESIGHLTKLRVLSIERCPNFTSLPDSFQNLTALQYVSILGCPELTTLPDSFRNLTALQHLVIRGCPDLSRRCHEPHGEYWPLIQRVADIRLDDSSS